MPVEALPPRHERAASSADLGFVKIRQIDETWTKLTKPGRAEGEPTGSHSLRSASSPRREAREERTAEGRTYTHVRSVEATRACTRTHVHERRVASV